MTPLVGSCPKKVWIGTTEFEIFLVEKNHAKLDNGESDGITEFNPPVIHLCQDLCLTLFMETLWHELTHAVNHVGDIEDSPLEEVIADQHGKVWSQFWINNPRFQRWWTKVCNAVRKERDG